MKIRSVLAASAVIVSTGFGTASIAQDLPFPVQARQGQMKMMGLNLGVLVGMVRGDTEYDADRASAAAGNLRGAVLRRPEISLARGHRQREPHRHPRAARDLGEPCRLPGEVRRTSARRPPVWRRWPATGSTRCAPPSDRSARPAAPATTATRRKSDRFRAGRESVGPRDFMRRFLSFWSSLD
jgi:hypothetical protein